MLGIVVKKLLGKEMDGNTEKLSYNDETRHYQGAVDGQCADAVETETLSDGIVKVESMCIRM